MFFKYVSFLFPEKVQQNNRNHTYCIQVPEHFLTSESKLDPEMLSDLRQKWNEMYANTGNTMMVLNKGLSFHESSNTSVEMQLRENKNDNNSLACQVFGLSPDAVSGA